MKKWLFIGMIMFSNYMITTAQVMSKIDDKLQLEMMQHARSEKLRINIILSEQYDQAEMQNKTRFIKNKEKKRSFVINELKNFSQVTQKNLIMFLSDMEARSAVSDIHPLWIVNMITCYANIETIETLSLRSDILIIGWDRGHYMQPEELKSTPVEPNREITYNVAKVQADKVWALGYTGQNVVVAIIDTGVNYDHNDLAGNMWTHPYYPYHGWNYVSQNNSNNPMDDHGHGTHCAGIVAGNGASGSQTGVAPNAKIMAVKVLDSWNSGGAYTANRMCLGIQFAVENGAHVINISAGIEGGGTQTDKITFRNAMINVLNMDIIAPTIAGNEGAGISPPNSIRVPGSCPPPWLHPDQTLQGGLTAVICVGSTDQNDNIGYDSSRGPVTWQNVSGFEDYDYNPWMGLIRPDVVAPGVDITSLSYINNSGYIEKSGTSMATPCVSGIIALMLSINPNLTPAEICEILETTAKPLSDTKSNTYGSGRVNAYAAALAVLETICDSNSPTVYDTITQNTTWDTPIRVVRSIIIPNGVTLIVTSQVKCGANTAIIVEPNGKLVINGGTLTTACDNTMWQGITVSGTNNNPCIVEVKNYGTIENAVCGINVLSGGSVITTTNAKFLNNKAGVKFSGQNATTSSFLQTHFILDNNYIGNPANCEALLKIEGGGEVLVATSTFKNSTSTNINNGIIVSNSSTKWLSYNNILSVPISIRSGSVFTNTGTIYCDENASITIHPNGKLMVDGGKFSAYASGTLWKGIVVLGDTTYRQLPQYQGSIELKNNAIIEHALCAISAAPASYSNAGGGIITATNTTFRNNLRAIEYRQYENKNSSGNIIDNVGKFTNCTFTIDNTNRFSANGTFFQYHVYMYGVRGITFSGCTFNNAATTGARGAGIYTMDAGFKVINTCSPFFASTGIDCACPSNYITHPSIFKNQAFGIFSSSTGTPRSIYIDQSEFQSIEQTGVRLSAQNNYRLTRCEFTDIKYRALYSKHSSGYRIEENNFSTSTISTKGIDMYNSGSAENKIYKNNFSNLDRGISVSATNGTNGNHRGDLPPGPGIAPSGLQFICNGFINNKYDIYIVSNGTVRYQQGTLLAGVDNRFTTPDVSSFYSLSPQTIGYYHRTRNTPPVYYAPYNPTSNVTIINTAAPNPCASTFCLIDSIGGPGTDFRSDLDSLAQYHSMQSHYDQLLAALGENPELLQELLMLSDAMRELSDHAISRILHDSILYLDALKSWYNVVRTPIAKYWLSEVYASERNYEQAEAILREIPRMFAFSESELIEHENYMQFYHFKKQMYQSGKDWPQLNEAEIAQLQRIAEATHGRSAGMAKGALCFFFDICYEDEPESPPFGGTEGGLKAEGMKAEGSNLQYELSIYPNPTSSEMTVTLNNPSIKIVQMEVFDLTNRKIYQQTVQQSYTTLRLNELEQGIYILKVHLNQGDVVIRKIVKQ